MSSDEADRLEKLIKNSIIDIASRKFWSFTVPSKDEHVNVRACLNCYSHRNPSEVVKDAEDVFRLYCRLGLLL